jgi:D-alanine-D-alanine ligase
MVKINKVIVLYGGLSSEKEISIQSGAGIHKALIELGYKADLKDIKDINDFEKLKNYDLVFIALHGVEGEGGDLQKTLDDFSIKYTGSKSSACSNTWNKWIFKEILNINSISNPRGYKVDELDMKMQSPFLKFKDIFGEVPSSLFMKPAEDGSSIDIFELSNNDDFQQALKICQNINRPFIFEEAIKHKEFTVTIINHECLPVIEIQTKNEFYDYDAKYLSNETSWSQAKLSSADLNSINEISLSAYKALNCFGWARVDILQDKNGKFYVIEINTVPGMTSHSCVPKSASYKNLSYKEVVQEIIHASLK